MSTPLHHTPKRLSRELQEISDTLEDRDLTLGELIDHLEGRVYTLLLVLLSLPFCQPLPLPGLSTPFGVVIALFGLRFAFRQQPWLPARFLRTQLTAKFIPAVLRGSAKILRTIERLLFPRLTAVFDFRLTQFFTGLVICMCGLFLLLPLPIPFSNMIPALTVILCASAFSERDGLCLGVAGVMFGLTLGFFGALIWTGAHAAHLVHSVAN
ncbi:MAG: exopolysaccharide biosynthesis protein [Chthoniobacterales bacterium]